MSVRHIQQFELDAVWASVEKYIQNALDTSQGEMNASQARYAITKGLAELFIVEVEGKVTGAAVVEFCNYPNYRVANVVATGGRGMVKEADEFKAWLKRGGASFVEGHCQKGVARLWESKLGMKQAYIVMRGEL